MIRNKYFNRKIKVGDLVFDSTREYKRYLRLKDAAEGGRILHLELQPTYELLPKQYRTVEKKLKTVTKLVQRVAEKAVTYTADFRYEKDGAVVVEDVKISRKLLPTEFVLKRKMMLFFHGICVRQVFDPDEEI